MPASASAAWTDGTRLAVVRRAPSEAGVDIYVSGQLVTGVDAAAFTDVVGNAHTILAWGSAALSRSDDNNGFILDELSAPASGAARYTTCRSMTTA